MLCDFLLQVLSDFLVWFEKFVTETYLTNSVSKLEIAQKLTSNIIQDVLISLDTFRNNMKKQFDSPMASFLTKASLEMTTYYTELLSKFTEGTYYFGTKKDFRQIGSNMNIWRIPVSQMIHDDVIKWKHFPRYWPFVRGIHRSPVNSPHKGQGRRALMFSLICAWINAWVNNREADDLRRHHTHYDVIVMWIGKIIHNMRVMMFWCFDCIFWVKIFTSCHKCV